MRNFLLAAVAAAAIAAPASAAVVYSNNFDAENGGASVLNYNGFSGLTVTGGTVDLVKSGDFGISCPGGPGACVDLDGSTGNAGLVSSASYAFNAGDRVALSFLFSGNQRGGADDGFRVSFNFTGLESGTYGYESAFYGNASFGSFNAPIINVITGQIPPNRPAGDLTFYFVADTAGEATFEFEDYGNDNVGIVIDSVSLDIGPNPNGAVPEPATWAILTLGLGVVGAASHAAAALANTVAA